ncbi:hypothetical protein [Actinoplanes awajinensis]|uniref:hypothetical protein n=1 Tax=Actinoplanes awajinensis TaxID=135946 RepID=UPI000837245E|nr:hypothetical protein [Actinoplanes awajinensis]
MPPLTIHLTDDEAFVLSDWIYELQQSKGPLSDEAVWPALYAIDGPFHTTSPLIFAPDYRGRLAAAQARMIAGEPGPGGPGLLVRLSGDEAVVLAHWLCESSPPPQVPVGKLLAAIEAHGVAGTDLPAARRRLLATMGRNEDGIMFEDVPGHRPAGAATRDRSS